jgi:hypothetical protein
MMLLWGMSAGSRRTVDRPRAAALGRAWWMTWGGRDEYWVWEDVLGRTGCSGARASRREGS